MRAGDDTILTLQSRYTFRTCLPPAQEDGPPILDLAQQRGVKSVGAIVADYAWGQAFKRALQDTFQGVSGIKLNIQVAPLPTTDFTPYLRALGNVGMIVATGHPPGGGAILAQAGQLGMKAPVIGAYSPFSLTAKAAGSSAYGRWADFKCMNVASPAYRALAKRYLRTFPQNGFFEDEAMQGYAYVKVARGGGRQGRPGSEEDLGVRPRQHVQHPRVRIPVEVDRVGRDGGADAVPHRPDQGPTARRRAEQGR